MIMALSRLGSSYNVLGNLSRISCSGNLSFRKSQCRDFSHFQGITNIRYNGQNKDLCLSYRVKNLKLYQWHAAPSSQFHTNFAEYKENTNVTPPIAEGPIKTKRQALKEAIARYGPVIFIFHICHSLVVLGIFYLLVKSGVDLLPIAKWLGKMDSDQMDQLQLVLCTSSTFVVAYTLYKFTAPIRIGVTLVGFPYVMRVLRRFGYQRGGPPRPTKP